MIINVFVGRMTADAEDISGDGVKFRLACDTYFAKSKQTTFVPCVAFGKDAETIKNFGGKGRQIGINAEYRTREFTYSSGPRPGEKGYDHSFVVQKVWLLGSGKQDGQGQAGPADAEVPGW